METEADFLHPTNRKWKHLPYCCYTRKLHFALCVARISESPSFTTIQNNRVHYKTSDCNGTLVFGYRYRVTCDYSTEYKDVILRQILIDTFKHNERSDEKVNIEPVDVAAASWKC
ncbi:hypothetical protein ANN_20376 [Periplaneta americana]|uniref:Uncharacterized protein n=1 Tax=Periplaneta americana TaxID=6978 RepID=A0ABQ8SCE4_PERAM|nr:hypothetical protein ANN_20376 [Periplaneta americana]